MNKSFNLHFYVKVQKQMPRASLLFTLRITTDGVCIEVSSKRYVNPDKWSTNDQKLTRK